MDDEHWQDAAHNSCAKVRREQARAPTPADDENKTSRTRWSRARSRVVHVRWPLENSTPRERPSPTTLPDLHRHIGSLVASLPPRARLGPPGISTFQITWPAHACTWRHHSALAMAALSKPWAWPSPHPRPSTPPERPHLQWILPQYFIPVHGNRSVTRVGRPCSSRGITPSLSCGILRVRSSLHGKIHLQCSGSYDG